MRHLPGEKLLGSYDSWGSKQKKRYIFSLLPISLWTELLFSLLFWTTPILIFLPILSGLKGHSFGFHMPVLSMSVNQLLQNTVGAALIEEAIFRGLSKKFWGYWGLVIGTIFWASLHPFRGAFTYGIIQPFDSTAFFSLPYPIFHLKLEPYTIVPTLLLGFFYIKLWRGRFWYLSFAFHAAWNALVFTVIT
ncbi:MAG: hypothetical protein HW384_2174 [Dehalococcoidia bacterium]|nr:hypothetical protein [Dehalococcoidia bacterium]